MSTLANPAAAVILKQDTKIGGRKADHAYRLMKRAIVLSDLPPGSQLLEQNLARDFGCSQGTVREALMRLTEDGLVARRGYQGTRVTSTSLYEVSEMVRVRLSIERQAARMISSLEMPPTDRTGLDHVLLQMDEAHKAEDYFRCSELDRTFHAEIARIAGLGLLSPVLQRCALHIHRFTVGSVEIRRAFSLESGIGKEHRELLQDLTEGSADAAEQAVCQHLQTVLLRWAPSVHEAVGEGHFRP